MSEWQPIETAPKDGKVILLAEQWPNGEWIMFTGSWDESRNVKFYKSKWKCEEYDAFSHDPTHWMPLPEPPKV